MADRTHQLDGRPNREPATALFSRRVVSGHEGEYETLAREMVAASERCEGHIASTVLHEDGSPDYVVLYSFADRRLLQAWLDSSKRRDLLERADRLAKQHLRLPPLTGLEAWFALPHRETIKPPPRWKMWLVSLLAIYPLVVTFQVTILPAIKTWPLLLRSAALPLTLLTLMTFLIMPVVTRIAQPWLSRSKVNA